MRALATDTVAFTPLAPASGAREESRCGLKAWCTTARERRRAARDLVGRGPALRMSRRTDRRTTRLSQGHRLLTVNNVPVEDTFAEAFPMTAARLLVTAESA